MASTVAAVSVTPAPATLATASETLAAAIRVTVRIAGRLATLAVVTAAAAVAAVAAVVAVVAVAAAEAAVAAVAAAAAAAAVAMVEVAITVTAADKINRHSNSNPDITARVQQLPT